MFNKHFAKFEANLAKKKVLSKEFTLHLELLITNYLIHKLHERLFDDTSHSLVPRK